MEDAVQCTQHGLFHAVEEVDWRFSPSNAPRQCPQFWFVLLKYSQPPNH
jgi:hypothetical protein